MSRDLKINILVDDHDAVQKLENVATAEDHVAASAKQTSVALDESQAQFKATSVSTVEADRYLSDLQSNLSRMPSTLSTVRGGLNDLADGLGLTIEELGLMNAAGLVVGTGFAAWQLGRVVAEVTGLDSAISRATATLLGWGNVAAETAAAKAEVLARASNSAGMEITHLSTAMEINAQKAQEQADRVQSVANGITRAEEASKSMRHELVEYLDREQKRWDAEDRATQQKIKRDAEELAGFREKIHAIEHDGDHAYSTLHQWYGEMHRDQQRMNDLADQNIKKLEDAQKAAEQFLSDALAAAQAIDAELGLTGPIGHGPTTPNPGSPLNPAPIVVRPIGPITPPGGVVTNQNTNTTLGSSGSTQSFTINVDAKGAMFEDDRSLARLTQLIAGQIGVQAGIVGASR